MVDSDYDTDGSEETKNEVGDKAEETEEEVELNVGEPNLVQSVQAEASEEDTEKVKMSENEDKVEQVQQIQTIEKSVAEEAKDSGNNSPSSEGKDHSFFLIQIKNLNEFLENLKKTLF